MISSVECDSSEDLLEEVKFKHALQYVSTHKDDIKIGIQKLETQCPGVTEKLKVCQFIVVSFGNPVFSKPSNPSKSAQTKLTIP